MTGPAFQYPDYNAQLGVDSDVARSEWDNMLKRRTQLVDDISNRLRLANTVRSANVTPPGTELNFADQVANQHQISGQNADGTLTDYQQLHQQGFKNFEERNQLMGAAQFWGIPNADKMPPEVLRQIVAQKRLSSEDVDRGLNPLVDVGMTAAAAAGLGATQGLVGMVQHIPFIGSSIAEAQITQRTSQWLNNLNEGVQAGMSEGERKGYRIAHGLGGVLGFIIPGEAAWRAAGAVGGLGAVAGTAEYIGTLGTVGRLAMSPIGRAAIQGAASAWMLEGGGDQSNQEAAMKVGAGAVGGVVFGIALPALANKVRGAFPSKSAPAMFDEPIAPEPPGTVDAEWYFEADHQMPGQLVPQSRRLGSGEGNGAGPTEPPSGALPPGEALVQGGAGQGPVDSSIRMGGGVGPDEAAAAAVMPEGQPQLMSPQLSASMRRIDDLTNEVDIWKQRAHTDEMTGLGNRAAFDRAVATADADPSLTVVLSDGKGIKTINDNISHQAGDQAIINHARAMVQTAQEMQIPVRIFRHGGDEFAAIVPAEQAEAYAARVKELSYQEITHESGAKLKTWLKTYTGRNYAEADIEMTANKRVTDKLPAHDENQVNLFDQPQITQGNLPTLETPQYPFPQALRNERAIDLPKTTAAEAAALTKQATLMEGPTLPELAGGTQIDVSDVAKSAMFQNPERINVIQGVGDASKVVRGLTQASVEGRIMPHQFRFVERNGQMDMLVSDGLPITNKRVAQYKEHGFFDQQQVMANGKDAIVMKANAGNGQARVYNPYTEESYLVPHDQIMPGRSSNTDIEGLAESGDRLYSRFQQLVDRYMKSESAKLPMGANVDTSWLSHETSSQLPRLMGDFLDAEVGGSKLSRAAIESYFNVRRVRDFQSLAPAEVAENTAANRELNVMRSINPREHIPVEDIAATKGFRYQVYPDGGGTLIDQLGDLKVPVTSDESAMEFLRGFNREMPDYSPIGDVPVEVAAISPHAANPGDALEPVMEGGAEHHTNLTERATERVTRVTARMLEGEPLQSAVVVGGGSSGGAPPPPREPFLSGGSQNELPPGPRSLGRQLAELQARDPRTLAKFLQQFDSAWLNLMTPYRSVALQVEQGLKDLGVTEGTLWRHYNNVTNAVTVAHNEALPWQQEYADIMSNFRRRFHREGTVTRIQEIGDMNQKVAAMQKAGYTDRERAAQGRLGDFNDRFFNFLMEDPSFTINSQRYVNAYMSHVRARQGQPGIQDPFADTNDILPSELKFFAEMAREGNMQFRQMDARVLGAKMIRAAFFKKHVGPAYAEMQQAWNDPRVPQTLREVATDWLNVVRTGHNPGYDIMIQGTRHILNKFGVPVTDGEVATLGNIAFGNMYRAQLGGRPDAIFRDSIQPFLGGVRIGFKPIAAAYRRFFAGGDETRAMIERGLKGGWLEKGQAKVANADVFEAGIQTPQGTNLLTEGEQRTREMLAKVGDAVWAMTPRSLRHGLQGSRLDPLHYYTKLGEVNRLISGDAGYQLAADALADYQYGMGKLVRGELSPAEGVQWIDQSDNIMAQLMKDSKAQAYPQPIQDEFKRLVTNGDMEGAAHLLANEAANSQFRYGMKENPIGIRKAGFAGRAVMQFGTFTQQYIAMMREMATGPGIPASERAAMLARYGTISAVLGMASAYTGWNFGKWAWHQSLTFAGGPAATQLYSGVQAVTGAIATAFDAPVTPSQRTALENLGRTSVGGVFQDVLASQFPYTSTFRTINNISTMARGENPIEGTARTVITGEHSLQPDIAQAMDAMGRRAMDPNAPWRANAGIFADAIVGQQQPQPQQAAKEQLFSSYRDTLNYLVGGSPAAVVNRDLGAGTYGTYSPIAPSRGIHADTVTINPNQQAEPIPTDFTLAHEFAHRLYYTNEPLKSAALPLGEPDPMLRAIITRLHDQAPYSNTDQGEPFAQAFAEALQRVRGQPFRPPEDTGPADSAAVNLMEQWIRTKLRGPAGAGAF
jgi:diguanylate cyclase (GGDEF)-like protein